MMKYKEMTEKIIGCAYRVYNKIGFGFLECVYENCLLKVEIKRKVRELPKNSPN
jgi:GxxExxY protein